MAFLIDLSQIEQSGIQYVSKYLNLDDLYISKVTGIRETENSIVSGNLEINKSGLDFELYGNINTTTGIIFKPSGLIGLKTIPTGYGIHIGNNNYYNGGIYINADSLNKNSEVLLLTQNEQITGYISKDISGNIILKNLNVASNTPSVSFKSKNSQLNIYDDIIYAKGLSFNTGIIFSGFYLSGTGYQIEIKNSNKRDINCHYYLLNLSDISGSGNGILSFSVLRGIGYTGDNLLVTGLTNYDYSKYQFPKLESQSLNQYSLKISGYETGFSLAGSVTELKNDIKKQYFVTGNDTTTLEIQKDITGFYTGRYTVYIKRIERYHDISSNTPFTGYQNSIIRNPYIETGGTNNVNWHLYGAHSSVSQSITLVSENQWGRSRSYISMPITNEYGNNFIYLLKLTNFPGVDPIIKAASYEPLTKNYTGYTGSVGNTILMPYSDPRPTQLLIESGSLYEFGLIGKLTSDAEDDIIFSRGNLSDVVSDNIISQNDIKFLFKFNYGSGSTVYDYTGGYTGKIININESYWL